MPRHPHEKQPEPDEKQPNHSAPAQTARREIETHIAAGVFTLDFL